MICEEYKFIRIHIKKCGGRSLWHLFPEPNDSHAGFGEYRAKLGEKIKDYFIWTIARNPWDRLVSLYFYEKMETTSCTASTFDDFMKELKQEPWKYDNSQQYHYLTDYTGQIAVDYVALLPNIDQDWEKIKRATRMPQDIMYPKMGGNDHLDYREYYNSETIQQVEELCPLDISFFGFKFDDKTAFRYPIGDLGQELDQTGWRARF
jgi:hypothetical protein